MWLKSLKFPNGYTTGLRRVVNVTIGNLTGLNSHDYDIIIERLLPGMFWGYHDDAMWKLLAKLRYFYRQLCAKEIVVEMTEKFE
jgi:hypothetical protein